MILSSSNCSLSFSNTIFKTITFYENIFQIGFFDSILLDNILFIENVIKTGVKIHNGNSLSAVKIHSIFFLLENIAQNELIDFNDNINKCNITIIDLQLQ